MPAVRPHQQIELVDIGSIVPHPDNPRQGDIGAIAESIAVNGWWGAVIVSRRADGTPVILAGEHRWRALNALQTDGYTRPEGETIPYDQLHAVPPAGKVPIIALDGLTLAQEQKVLLADNRANDLAAYDDSRLAELLTGLAESGDLLGTLFDGDDVDAFLHSLLAPPPDLDDLHRQVGGPTVEDGLERITIMLPADLAAAFRDALQATGEDSPHAEQILIGTWLQPQQ